MGDAAAELQARLAAAPEGPRPVEMTAEEIRDHLDAGEEVWIWEKDHPRHKVYGVEPLSPDHVVLGAEYKVVFKGAMTGLMCGLQMTRTRKLQIVTRKPKEPDA